MEAVYRECWKQRRCARITACCARCRGRRLRQRARDGARIYLFSELSISITTSTDSAIVMGLGLLNIVQLTSGNIRGSAGHCVWCVWQTETGESAACMHACAHGHAVTEEPSSSARSRRQPVTIMTHVESAMTQI